MTGCDKCGKEVARREDATFVDAIYYGNGGMILFHTPRHIACSPSRAQYITVAPYGEPDPRPEYDKRSQPDRARYEREFTAAYLEHMRRCDEEGV